MDISAREMIEVELSVVEGNDSNLQLWEQLKSVDEGIETLAYLHSDGTAINTYGILYASELRLSIDCHRSLLLLSDSWEIDLNIMGDQPFRVAARGKLARS
jgi:hypothetical protein